MIAYGLQPAPVMRPGLRDGCSDSDWLLDWYVDPDYVTPANAVWSGESVSLIARAGGHFGVVGIDQRAVDTLGRWARCVRVEYDMMFDPTWAPVGINDEGKLIGIYSTAQGSDDADGGNPATGENGFSVRTMFRAEADGIIPMSCYVYHVDQAGDYGDKFDWRQSGGGMLRGVWYRVMLFVQINSSGNHDGVIAVHVDGQPVLARRDLQFVTDASALPGIERVRLQLYWGGSSTPPADSAVHVRHVNVWWI